MPYAKDHGQSSGTRRLGAVRQCSATPTFFIPGTGTLTIENLSPDQTAKKGTSSSRAFICPTPGFRARIQVVAPATSSVICDGGGADVFGGREVS